MANIGITKRITIRLGKHAPGIIFHEHQKPLLPEKKKLPNRASVAVMTWDELQAELKAYQPQMVQEVVSSPEHLARRAELWRRVDEYVR